MSLNCIISLTSLYKKLVICFRVFCKVVLPICSIASSENHSNKAAFTLPAHFTDVARLPIHRSSSKQTKKKALNRTGGNPYSRLCSCDYQLYVCLYILDAAYNHVGCGVGLLAFWR